MIYVQLDLQAVHGGRCESRKDWMTGTSDPYCVCRPNGKAGQIWKGTQGLSLIYQKLQTNGI